jgi:hypothetical protein
VLNADKVVGWDDFACHIPGKCGRAGGKHVRATAGTDVLNDLVVSIRYGLPEEVRYER